MQRRLKIIVILLIALGGILLLTHLAQQGTLAVFNPKGMIATKERSLMLTATLLMLIVVIPVLVLTFGIAWKYRASNTKAKYTPYWDHHTGLEAIWWGLPCAIILILAIVTWNASHDLDPSKALASANKPITIQVIALEWKWLFIYPDQDIATVNFVEFPENTPVNFEITSDAPMNSFWIPQLGGQMYAMAGMSTHLHLIADAPGSFAGSSANLSGSGFAGMKFTAKSTTQSDFDQWIQQIKLLPGSLTMDEYNKLAQPSKDTTTLAYPSKEPNLYDKVIMKFMAPGTNHAEYTY
jgi:cytochrome o ubiquinol oxidase subunit 2